MIENKVVRTESLARHTTLRIGGPAEFFVRVDSVQELIEAVRWARAGHLETFILGNGSNILVSDAGIRGLVIENHADRVTVLDRGDRATVQAESGASLAGLANRLARQGWRGLEWAIGVPATMGGAIVNNAGAHNGAISDTLKVVTLLDRQNAIIEWSSTQARLGYRTSYFKAHPQEYIVLEGQFELERDTPANCIARMNQYTEHRRRTQPTDPSVGSMFKNPAGDHAGRLIEAAGLKGMRMGAIQVSPVHANFFVNLGGATAQNVLDLVQVVQDRVQEKFDIRLELEIQLVGVSA